MCDPICRGCKVYYRPIEAAIRWAGLLRREAYIFRKIGHKQILDPEDFPRWPVLRLYEERLYDAMANHDLPYGKEGITMDNPPLLSDPDLTLRHVDLKAWMSHFYPDQKPEFLFDDVERSLHAAVSVEAIQALLTNRTVLIQQLAHRNEEWEALKTRFQKLQHDQETQIQTAAKQSLPGPRSEATYLCIVGGLLGLLLGQSPSGKRFSSFASMESVIDALVAHHPGHPGMSERTLWTKLAQAKRHLEKA